jgi:glycosyltransferase involved in cell wall biosynthesis
VTYVTVPVMKSVPNPWLRRALELRAVRAVADLVLAIWVAVIRRRTDFSGRDAGLYVSNIFYGRILGRMARRFAVYDCNDNHLAFPGTPAWATGYLRRVVGVSDVVVVSSNLLREEIEPLSPRRIVEIGNGVDFPLFDAAFHAPRRPPEIAALPRPIIGYAGALAEWIDLDLIAVVAAAFPAASVVLVGPTVGQSVRPAERFASHPNVHWLGSKPHEDLPHWVAEMDVCLIPFRCTPLTRGVNPNKLWEYFALGKPVVMTDFSPFVHEFKNLASVAATPEAFVAAIRTALASPGDVAARREVAQRNSWDGAAARMVHLFETLATR